MPSSSLPPAAEVVPRLSVRDPDWWLKALAWTVIIASALLTLTFSFGRDQGIYALVGEGILRGEAPYKALWDFKPPGIFFVHALAQGLFGKNMMAPRLLEALALLADVALMRRISAGLFESRTVGLLGAAVMALIHAEMDFWHTGQPETFGAFFTLLGLALTLEPTPRRRLFALLVGVTFGCAALLKPPLGGGALVCGAYLVQRERTRGKAPFAALGPLAWLTLGGLLPVVACLIWFAAKGALSDLYWTLFEFTPGYTKISWEGRRPSDMLYHAIEEAFFKFSALGAAGVIAAVSMTPLSQREREGLLLTLGVIAMHVTGIAMQGKFFAYHYGATLPLIALLAGLGLYKLWRRCLGGGVGAILAYFAFVAVAVPMRYAVRDLPQFFAERSWIRLEYLLRMAPYRSREAMDQELSYVADYSLAADRRVALEVRARTRPADRVFVWGFEPVIFWLADRRPASRFIYNVAQRSPWEVEHARRELMSDLRKTPPALVVVQSRDVFSFVTGNNLDSRDSLPGFPELDALLERNYAFATRVEDFDLYTRLP
jgi:4-amino-4-deoxy-L-arabinose transferase-like glycosyltransferase